MRAASATSSGNRMPVEDSTAIPLPSARVAVNFLLPDSADAFRVATWGEIEPYYQELAARSLDESTVEQWLTDWSQLDSLVSEASTLAYVERRGVVAGIFDQMLAARQQVGHNAGFENYRDFVHREKNRFDYTPDDCMRFHEAVEETMRPATTRILERRKQEMRVGELRPWDITVDPHVRAPLRPFR